MHKNSSSSPLNSSANILARAAGVSGVGGVIFPIVVPHGKPSVLEWLNPSYYGSRHYLDY